MNGKRKLHRIAIEYSRERKAPFSSSGGFNQSCKGPSSFFIGRRAGTKSTRYSTVLPAQNNRIVISPFVVDA